MPSPPKLRPAPSPLIEIPKLELPEAMLSIDHRERDLIGALTGINFDVLALPVGDLLCKYATGNGWIAERKRVDDLARSITTGRWRDQVGRLHATEIRHIFFLIEGDLRATNLRHESLIGACINAELRKDSHVIRTMDMEETVVVVRHLVAKGGSFLSTPLSLTPPMSKHRKEADRETCWLRQLMCIPSISEPIARKMLEEFGTLPAIKRALEHKEGIEVIKKVRINHRNCIGDKRIETLAHYLVASGHGRPPLE